MFLIDGGCFLSVHIEQLSFGALLCSLANFISGSDPELTLQIVQMLILALLRHVKYCVLISFELYQALSLQAKASLFDHHHQTAMT